MTDYSDIISQFYCSWSSYLNEKDYNYLLEFIYNLKNNISNDKILILHGLPRTGKTTLINEMKKIVGKEHFHDNSFLEGEKFFQPRKRAIHIYGIQQYQEKKYLSSIKTMFENNVSIISDTNSLEKIDKEILENAYVIHMPDENQIYFSS